VLLQWANTTEVCVKCVLSTRRAHNTQQDSCQYNLGNSQLIVFDRRSLQIDSGHKSTHTHTHTHTHRNCSIRSEAVQCFGLNRGAVNI
ncbi:hypothetical protein ATANTOWER_005523, partial [Ataeniobius toweri]|nr:hypothetical protein [Ataeniobius toweri]